MKAKISVIGVSTVVQELQQSVAREIKNLADLVQQEARVHTPKRTGNARRNWNKSVDANGFRVENKVNYIGRLEAGASQQAPKGITQPTLNSVKRKLNK
jgi:ABC-type sulfate transport system substrate-binding protein